MKKNVLYLVGVLLIAIVIASPMQASCSKCSWPPPYTNATCTNTYYNGSDGCLTSGPNCVPIGSCSGPLGDDCDPNSGCVLDQWACGAPLAQEWRLESFTVEVFQIAAAEKTPRGKA